MRILFLILSLVSLQAAGPYYVKPSGNNALDGLSLANAWQTIGKATSSLPAGETVYIQPGTYEEGQLSIANGGSSSNAMTTFIGFPGTIFKGGFDLNGDNNVKFLNLTITHDGTTYFMDAWRLRSLTNVVIANCIVTNLNALNAVVTPDGSLANQYAYCHFFSNYWYNIGMTNGVLNGKPAAIIAGTSNLVEYNIIGNASDFFRGHGTNNVIRNNKSLPIAQDTFAGLPHVDFLQTDVSESTKKGTRNLLLEANWSESNNSSDSHFYISQERTTNKLIAHNILRGNVIVENGDTTIINDGSPRLQEYHNTFYLGQQHHQTFDFHISVDASLILGSTSTNVLSRNSIHYQVNTNTTGKIYNQGVPGYQATLDTAYLQAYLSGTPTPSGTGNLTSDPLFTDATGRNFALQSGSPSKASAGALTTAVGTGVSTTTLVVANSDPFTSGWAIGVPGDLITIGAGSSVRITAIDEATHTITLAEARSWSNGDGVRLALYPADRGALPYSYSPLTAALLHQNGTAYTVTTSGNARGVWFYQDNIPHTYDDSEPYTATIASGVVTAKAFSLYAQASMVIDASGIFKHNNLRIQSNSRIQ